VNFSYIVIEDNNIINNAPACLSHEVQSLLEQSFYKNTPGSGTDKLSWLSKHLHTLI
jgi:hypothetical protein